MPLAPSCVAPLQPAVLPPQFASCPFSLLQHLRRLIAASNENLRAMCLQLAKHCLWLALHHLSVHPLRLHHRAADPLPGSLQVSTALPGYLRGLILSAPLSWAYAAMQAQSWEG